jgi:hypothetical protein
MVDFSQLLGGDPGGLLTPEQAGGVNQNFLQAIGAGLMKASGPSPYKPGMTAFSGIGEALQGGLAARREAQKDALAQTVARAKMLEALGPLLKQQAYAHSVGESLLPEQQHLLDALLGTVMGRSSAASRAAGMPVTPGASGASGAPGTPGTGPRAEGTSAEATGVVPTSVNGFKTNFLFDLAKEYNLSPQAVADKEHPQHEFLMKVADRRATDVDRVHQQTITEQKMQDKELEDLGKRVKDLRDLGQLTPETLKPITDRMREIGVDEGIIKRLATGTAPPIAKPVTTVPAGPAGPASIAAGIGTPPVPSPAAPAGGLPAAPAPVMPPGPPPPSPLRTGAPSPSFLPPPAGELPPLAKPPTAAPPTAAPVTPPVAPPVAPEITPPVTPPAKPTLAPSLAPGAAATAQKLTETMDQRTQRLGFDLSAQRPTDPMHPMWKKAVEEDLARIPNLKSEATREEIKSMGKEYAGIQALGRVSAELHNIGEQAQAIMERPDFNSSTGFGAETKLQVNRLLVSMGVKGADGASSAEIFNKLFSEALQGRIEAAKSESSELGPAGRQYLTQLNIMAKASPNIENTYETNKYLVTQMMRQSLKHMEIANEATKYASKNEFNSLDKGWNPIHIQMLKQSDFSPTEQKTIIAKEPMGPPTPPRKAFPQMLPGGEEIPREHIKRESNFAAGRERFIDMRTGKVIVERPMYGD